MKTVSQKIEEGYYNSKLSRGSKFLTCTKCEFIAYIGHSTPAKFCSMCGHTLVKDIRDDLYQEDQKRLFDLFITEAFDEYSLSHHNDLEKLKIYMITHANEYGDKDVVENIRNIHNAILEFVGVIAGFKDDKK
jgi:hypothetical protein